MNDLKEFGKKLVDKAIAGKTGHRIAIIGNEIFGSLDSQVFESENYTVELYPLEEFHKLDRLVNYTLCIVSYDAFSEEDNQNNFIKQMLEAIEQGVNFCLVYYKENYIYQKHSSSRTNVGYQVATKLSIYPKNLNKIIPEANVKRQEFQPFLKKWGVTNLTFNIKNEDAKAIYITDDNEILGFSVPTKNAEIFYLPFIRNLSNLNDTKNGLETLIDNLLTYLAKSRINLPIWAKESSFFSDEETLLKEKISLQSEITKLETDLQKFDEAKSLLFHNEHHLEITLPNFLKSYLGLEIEQNETYKEDFWIVDNKKEKLAIAEIKSKTKGFTKGLVGYLIAHRDYYELEDEFPALLFVNCNLQVGSWKDKDKFLNEQDYKYVAHQNVLVIRIEDVVRLWEMKRLGKTTNEEILNLFLTKKGWLQVTSKLEIKIHPK
ncbi:MAG: hypothetical protein H0W58_09490 [Acidobacteria bacterium]|nr:hypothetical protein [Acidobacteriota bacterium]